MSLQSPKYPAIYFCIYRHKAKAEEQSSCSAATNGFRWFCSAMVLLNLLGRRGKQHTLAKIKLFSKFLCLQWTRASLQWIRELMLQRTKRSYFKENECHAVIFSWFQPGSSAISGKFVSPDTCLTTASWLHLWCFLKLYEIEDIQEKTSKQKPTKPTKKTPPTNQTMFLLGIIR